MISILNVMKIVVLSLLIVSSVLYADTNMVSLRNQCYSSQNTYACKELKETEALVHRTEQSCYNGDRESCFNVGKFYMWSDNKYERSLKFLDKACQYKIADACIAAATVSQMFLYDDEKKQMYVDGALHIYRAQGYSDGRALGKVNSGMLEFRLSFTLNK